METRDTISNVLDELYRDTDSFLGYPCNTDFDYTPLLPLMRFAINNIGDAFADGNFKLNTHRQEQEVIRWYQDLFNADHDRTWGYCNNGGSEGNIYAMYIASQNFPDATVYYTRDSHYSIAKAAKLVGLPVVEVPTDYNGEMLYGALRMELERDDEPAIVFANVGTTFTGAIDDVNHIKEILDETKPSNHYVHADAALFGSFLPFEDYHKFDFRYGVNSISISGHKFLGMPTPAGVCIVTKEDVKAVANNVSYIRTYDCTLSGSRNGITPMMFWYAINTLGKDGMVQMFDHMMETADEAIRYFELAGITAWRNQDSPIVIFEINRVSKELIEHYQIATVGTQGHICCMAGTKLDVIKQFINKIGG